MATRIKDLPRFHADCIDYQKRIESIKDENIKRQAITMFETFLNTVDALDKSVDNLADAGPVFGNEHQLVRENLNRVRMDLVRWLKKHSPLEQSDPIPVGKN
jgi:molecular chaperone GrpE (heat shock protein)